MLGSSIAPPLPLNIWESIQNFAAFFIFFWLLAVIIHHFFCRKFQWYQNQVLSGSIQVSFGRIYLTSHALDAPIQGKLQAFFLFSIVSCFLPFVECI